MTKANASWKDTLVSPDTPILEAVRIMDETAAQICLVIDSGGKLLGTVTDGDIRRGILKSLPLSEPVTKLMNPKPQVTSEDESRDARIQMMTRLSVHQIPIVDGTGCVVGLETLEGLIAREAEHDNWVVLMAGGIGSRLRPLTEQTPKPLLEVGGRPLLETILKSFVKHGFRRFYISVNYMSGLFRDHFGDGEPWGVEIRYLDEDKPLGTAGPLGLIGEVPSQPLLVMNGDLLTKVNFAQFLNYHRESGADATMGVREYDFQVPFGVVQLDGHQIKDIEEKPVHRFFINAGMYVIDASVLGMVEKNVYLDMPDLFRRLRTEGKETTAFPVREYWMDIGRIDDLDQAKKEFTREFPQGLE